MPVISTVCAVTNNVPCSSCAMACSPANTRTGQPSGSSASIRVARYTFADPNSARAKLSTAARSRSSVSRPRNSSLPVCGANRAVKSAGPSLPAVAFFSNVAFSEKTSGKAASNSPTTRSKSAWATSLPACSDTSASLKVIVALANSATAAMPAVVADDQLGLGTPRPTMQVLRPTTPAAVAAARMRARATSVSAEQASNRADVASLTKRSVNGVSTGRGADMSTTTFNPGGLVVFSCVTRLRFSASETAIAVIATRSAATEIFDRGNSCKAATP